MPNIASLLNKTINTKRQLESVGATGFSNKTLTTNLSSVPCRVQGLKATDPVLGGRKISRTGHVVYVAGDIGIIMADVIEYNSEDYNIIDIIPEGNNDLYIKLLLEIVE